MGTEDMAKFEEALATVRGETNPEASKTVIGTHSDSFHCDEVTAIAMLLYTEAFKNSIIVRTRVDSCFDKLDIVCDVGGIYDHAKKRYDHHQSTFGETWNNDKDDISKLSSAGLIYRHYGKEVVKNICAWQWGVTLSDEQVNKVYKKLYKKMIIEIDANDNGVDPAPKEHLKYWSSSSLPSRVARCNPAWNCKKEFTQHVQFKKALALVEEEILWGLRGIVLVHMPAYEVVKEAWDAREKFHSSGEIMFMDRWAPWKNYIFEIEEEESKKGLLKFMISKD